MSFLAACHNISSVRVFFHSWLVVQILKILNVTTMDRSPPCVRWKAYINSALRMGISDSKRKQNGWLVVLMWNTKKKYFFFVVYMPRHLSRLRAADRQTWSKLWIMGRSHGTHANAIQELKILTDSGNYICW